MSTYTEALNETAVQAGVIADYSDPLEALRSLVELERTIQAARESAVELARFSGESWAAIGAALGMSKQAAWERYGRPDESSEELFPVFPRASATPPR